MNSEPQIDVKAAIEKNSYLTSVADLERRGKRQVKVIKTSLIYDLINRAVENVQGSLASGLDESERQKLVEDSKAEFDRLLAEQQGQRRQLEELQESNLNYERLVNELNRQVAEHADRTRALEEENARYQAELQELSSRLGDGGPASGGESARVQKLTDKIHGLDEALKVARQASQENERKLLAQIDALKQQEASRDESAGHLHEIIRRREAEVEQGRGAEQKNEEYRLQIAGLTAELKAVRENQPAADSLLNELRQMREDLKTLENRNRELEAIAATGPAPAPAGVPADTSGLEQLFEKKMAQISAELSAKLASLKTGTDAGTSPEDIKLTIQRIFSDDLDNKVDSNIGEIKVKETKSGGIASNLERLKNLGLKSDRK